LPIKTIPFFASKRINTAAASMGTQTEAPNVRAISPDAIGGEVAAQLFLFHPDATAKWDACGYVPRIVDLDWTVGTSCAYRAVRAARVPANEA
jgi:hypothetical protein